jgi:hypothetical protein
MISNRLILVAGSLAALQLKAQEACVGPGAALGVLSYQCASCGFSRENGVNRWDFSSEPVITAVAPWSGLKAGDVIQEVKGSPITTRAGAEAFTNPVVQDLRVSGITVQRPGDTTRVVRHSTLTVASPVAIRVRRNGQSVGVVVSAMSNCGTEVRGRREPGGGTRGGGGAGTRVRGGADGAGGSIVTGDSITANWQVRDARVNAGATRILLDSLREFNGTPGELRARLEAIMLNLNPNRNTAGFERTGRFGFAVSCTPSCTKATAQDGTEYWKYDGFPAVAEVRGASPAALAGLVVGDIVTSIDGESLLTEAGALKFFRNAQTGTTLSVTVKRNGQDVVFLLTSQAGARGGGGVRGRRGGPPPPN